MSDELNLTKIAIFKGKHVRKILHNNEWWFSLVDVVQVLTDQDDTTKARKYWNKLAQRLKDEGSELVTFCHQLKLPAADGKLYLTDCANTEGIFRIIQSIPSPKADLTKIHFTNKSLGGILVRFKMICIPKMSRGVACLRKIVTQNI